MDKTPYYVIKPTLHNKQKVTFGDRLDLTEKQAQPLLNGGFIGTHQPSSVQIGELTAENERLRNQVDTLQGKLNAVQQASVDVKAPNTDDKDKSKEPKGGKQ